MSENQFKLTRDASGLSMFIKSPKIEAFFKEALGNRYDTYRIGSSEVSLYIAERFDYRALTNIFASKNEAAANVPCFHEPLQSNLFFGGNTNYVNVNSLYIRGLSSGITVRYNGLYSNEKMNQIGKAFKLAMDYLINEGQKNRIVRFEIVERETTSNVETLVYPNPVQVGE